jgi:hypothetical protein
MPHHSPVNNDQATRSAGRIATLIALPLALLAGFGVFQLLKPAENKPLVAPPPVASQVVPTTPVPMTALPLNERQTVVCRALLSQLPEQVRHLPRRAVTAGHEQNAAYGEPALTLSCGGSTPTGFPDEEIVYQLNNVCWRKDPASSVWTTIDREVPVHVTVPAGLEGPGQWVTAFSGTVTATVPSLPQVPFGCKKS